MNDIQRERWERYRLDSRDTEDLISEALNEDREEDTYWEPVSVLQHRLPEILPRIAKLAESSNARERRLAATILGQNGLTEKIATNECINTLVQLLSGEAESKVISSILYAFGHLRDERSITSSLRFKNHSNAEVRHSVVFAISGFEDQRALAALIQLSSDPKLNVRNWATFGLGSLSETNTVEIRDALAARLDEADDEVRGEAMVGLALRGDRRMLPAFLKEIEINGSSALEHRCFIREIGEALIEHNEMGKERLPALLKLKALHACDAAMIEKAIADCS